MVRDKSSIITTTFDLSSIVRGLYGRVAKKLDFDPSYVSRVARGERRSKEVEAALEAELKRVLRMVTTNHNGTHRNGTAKRQSSKRSR